MRFLTLILLAFVSFSAPSRAQLSNLEQIEVETMAGLREVGCYQLKIAESHYLKGEHKVALSEYEKFLTLCEASVAPPYAQLMGSHCQVRLKKLHTAIRDGFQSGIDYWPESREAVLASFLIADTYNAMGEVEKAEPAYLRTFNDHPDEQLAVLARVQLLEIARTRGDANKRLALLRDLAFKVKRTEAANVHAVNAGRELASILLGEGKLAEAPRGKPPEGGDRDLPRTHRRQSEGGERLPLGHCRVPRGSGRKGKRDQVTPAHVQDLPRFRPGKPGPRPSPDPIQRQRHPWGREGGGIERGSVLAA